MKQKDLTVSEILGRYKDHQSIIKIRFQMNIEKSLSQPVKFEKVLTTINSLKKSKGSLRHIVPAKTLDKHLFSASFSPCLTEIL